MRIIDLLADDRFHLGEDDVFLVRAFQPVAGRVLLDSSPHSTAVVDRMSLPRVRTTPTGLHGGVWRRVKPRVIYWLRAMGVARGGADDLVLLQSFEETSAMALTFRLRSSSIVPILTNHIAEIEKRPRKRRALGALLHRAAAVVVYSEYERAVLSRLFPSVAGKIRKMKFHKPGTPRPVSATRDRLPLLSYVGWSRYDKGLEKVVAAAAEYAGPFRFGIFGKHGLDAPDVARLQARGAEVLSGYLADDAYQSVLSRSRALLLPYAKGYEGKLSGVFCDAIATETPVVAPPIEPFREFFAAYGELGLMVDFEIPDWWRSLDELLDDSRYEGFRAALRRAREAHAFPIVAAGFSRLLSVRA